MADQISQLVSNGFTLTIALATLAGCLFAVVRGQWPEKAVGVGYMTAWGLSLMVYDREGHIQPSLAAVDGVALLALGWLALGTKRAWLLWATAAQLLTVLTHLAMAIGIPVSLAAYVSALGIWGFVVVAALFVGALQYPARRGGLSWT